MSVTLARKIVFGLFLLAALCLIPFSAGAQNITTVTATIVDPNGLPYSGAAISAQLLPSGVTPTIPPPCNGQSSTPCAVSAFSRATADPTGTFSMNLASNAVLSPGGTTWQFTVSETGIAPPSGAGPQSFVVAISISGASQNISANLSAGAPKLTSGSGGGNALINNLPDPANLLADYQMNSTDTVASLPDYSGKGNSATGTVGTAPTITPVTGGLSCTGNGAVKLPASVNGAKTILIAYNYQPSSNTNVFNAPIMGSGAGATNSAGLIFYQITVTDAWGNESVAGPVIRTYATNNTFNSSTQEGATGTQVITEVMDTTDRIYLGGTETPVYVQTGASVGLNTNPYQICGAAANTGNATQTYFTGTILRVVMWSGVESAANVAQAAQLTQQVYQARGFTFSVGANDHLDAGVVIGDSITAAALFGNVPQLVPQNGLVNQTPNILPFLLSDNSIGGTRSGQMATLYPFTVPPFLRTNGSREFVIVEAGTNNSPGGFAAMQAANGDQRFICSLAHLNGTKCIIDTMIDRAGESTTWKDLLNPMLRQCMTLGWCDGIADVGGDPNLGCDGCNANATYFLDTIHPTVLGSFIYGTETQRAINRVFGNTNATQATTYTVFFPNIPPTHIVDQNAGSVTTFNNTGFTSPFSAGGQRAGQLTAGNFLFCVVHWNGAAVTATTPTDILGNTFVAGTQIDNGNSHTKPFWVFSLVGGGDIITFGFSGAAFQVAISCTEYPGGVDTLDLQSGAATGSSTAPLSTGITTTKPNELVIGFAGMDGQPASVTMGGSFTIRQQNAANIAQALQGDQLNKAAGTYTPSFTLGTSEVWEIGAIGFYRAAASVPLKDEDIYVNGGVIGAAETAILPACVSATGTRVTFNNVNTAGFAWTLQGFAGTDVIGDAAATTLATTNGHVVILEDVLTSQSSPACHWKIIQQ